MRTQLGPGVANAVCSAHCPVCTRPRLPYPLHHPPSLYTQAKNINLSLMTLGRVLNCLSEGHGVPPLRDSKLTRILADSFGGNARTWMLACVSGSAYNWQESMSTLSYAASAKKIVNKAHVNAMMQKIEDREKLRQVLELP